MFGQLIKPRWQHRDPAVRLIAVSKLNIRNDEHRAILTRLADGDSDAGVRRAAVACLLDISQLGKLQQRDRDDSVRTVAAEQIQRLLSGQVAHGPTLENRVRLICLTDNADVLSYVARNSDDADCRLAAIERLDDGAALVDVALHGHDEPTRVAATDRIDDAELLKKIIRAGRDKRALRLAREKLKALQTLASEQQQASQRCSHIVEELEAHVRRTFDNLYQPRLDQLLASWAGVREHADPTQTQQADHAIAACQQRLQSVQAEKDLALTIENAAFEQRETLSTLQQIHTTLDQQSWQDSNSLRALITTQRNRWDAATEQHSANPNIEKQVIEKLQQWQLCFDHIATLNNLNDEQDEQNAIVVEQPEALSIEENDTDAVESPTEEALSQSAVAERAPASTLETNLETDSPQISNDADNAFAEKLIALRNLWPSTFPMPEQLAQAKVTRLKKQDSDQDKVAKHNKKEQHRAVQNVLGALQRELSQRNLKHANRLWRKAETLLAEDGAPDWQGKLDKLKPQLDELRDWQAFAANPKKEQLCLDMEALVDSSMDADEKAGAIHALHDAWRELMSADQDADQDSWDRFRAASDKAYEPCREHFREIDALRKENMKKRKALVNQLKTFIEAQDWENADWPSILEIRRTAPNEWKSHQPINFTEIRDLGRAFSKLLTTLDEKLKQTSDTNSASLEGIIASAQALLEQENSRDSVDQFKALQARWKNAGWVQAGRYHSLHKKFRKLGDQLFQQLDQQRKDYKEQMQGQTSVLNAALKAFTQALDADDAVNNLSALQQQASELAALPCPSREKQLDQHRQDALQQLKQLKQWQPAWQRWHTLIEQVRGSTEQPESPAHRELAVSIEFAVGCDSPEDARDERMQWQLKQLQQAMTGGNQRSAMESVTNILKEKSAVIADGLSSAAKARLIAALTTLEPKR
ncbi:MAG: DUF349 domain-containing protein [Gammaproteobacteria bacterium]|nr:DUF349 domain-containing protein [Gammaproteobacteria bacterium]MBQ0774089.1 DUF349 domain-containing protein [Gammaproteobacteria bacterium]